MVGNAWEWVAGDHGEKREVRGSSWGSEPGVANGVHRRLIAAHHRSPNGGFRCAYSEPPGSDDGADLAQVDPAPEEGLRHVGVD
jgi:hypothetical protein